VGNASWAASPVRSGPNREQRWRWPVTTAPGRPNHDFSIRDKTSIAPQFIGQATLQHVPSQREHSPLLPQLFLVNSLAFPVAHP
jgi:hypothetical protein